MLGSRLAIWKFKGIPNMHVPLSLVQHLWRWPPTLCGFYLFCICMWLIRPMFSLKAFAINICFAWAKRSLFLTPVTPAWVDFQSQLHPRRQSNCLKWSRLGLTDTKWGWHCKKSNYMPSGRNWTCGLFHAGGDSELGHSAGKFYILYEQVTPMTEYLWVPIRPISQIVPIDNFLIPSYSHTCLLHAV